MIQCLSKVHCFPCFLTNCLCHISQPANSSCSAISLMSSFSSFLFHDRVTWWCHTLLILQITQALAGQWVFSRGQSGVIVLFGFALFLKYIWVFMGIVCELWCVNFSLRTVHAWSLGKMHKHRFLSEGMDLQISEINAGASHTLSADPKGMLN